MRQNVECEVVADPDWSTDQIREAIDQALAWVMGRVLNLCEDRWFVHTELTCEDLGGCRFRVYAVLDDVAGKKPIKPGGVP